MYECVESVDGFCDWGYWIDVVGVEDVDVVEVYLC